MQIPPVIQIVFWNSYPGYPGQPGIGTKTILRYEDPCNRLVPLVERLESLKKRQKETDGKRYTARGLRGEFWRYWYSRLGRKVEEASVRLKKHIQQLLKYEESSRKGQETFSIEAGEGFTLVHDNERRQISIKLEDSHSMSVFRISQ